MIVAPVSRAQFELVDELPESTRGDGGFGSTGIARHESLHRRAKARSGRYLGDLLASIGVDVAYAPRALDAVTAYDADVAIVATKAYDTDGAIETLRKAIAFPEKCVFVSPQNGVGNEEKLAAAFGAEQRRRRCAHGAGRSRSRRACKCRQGGWRPCRFAGGRERLQLAGRDFCEQRFAA